MKPEEPKIVCINGAKLIRKYQAAKGDIEKQITYLCEKHYPKKPFKTKYDHKYLQSIKEDLIFENLNYKEEKEEEIEKKKIERAEQRGKKVIELGQEIVSYYDKFDLAKQFIELYPLYYDKNKIWWVWNKKEFRWILIDEIDILNSIKLSSQADIINSKERTEIINALKQTARLQKPKDVKESWVQFKNKIIDIETEEEWKATSEYFITNPINWSLGENEETPIIDNLFISWVGEEHKQELYELLAFSIVPNYFIHRIFCLIGSGSNGKSTFLKILNKFLGLDNVTSSSLNSIMKERFEGSKLLNKLVCMIGETNFELITNTSYLKNLTGEDLVRCEFKGKDGFDFVNYAKIVMATNSLPPTADKTEGYYRRWKRIKFPNKFEKEKEVLKEIPKKEYENLSRKCLKIVKRLWKERMFTNDGTFEDRKKAYEEEANPMMKFLKSNYKKDINSQILFSEFFEDLNLYLDETGNRKLTASNISKQLKNESFEVKPATINKVNARYIFGLKGKNDSNDINDTTLTLNSYGGSNKKPLHLSNLSNSIRKIDCLKSTSLVILKENQPFNLTLETGNSYPISYFGDDPKQTIKILEEEGKIKLN